MTYQAAYEVFGRHGNTASSQEWGTNPDRQQANTKDEDPTGLLNEGFRYRDLETGTFITRDPLGFVDGPNLYTYVVQNPWTKFDPLGLSKRGVPGVKDTDHHVVPVATMRKKLESGDWNRHLTDALETMKVPAGLPRGLPRHTTSGAHIAYSERAENIVNQLLSLAKSDGVDIAGMSAQQSREMAQMMVDQINSDSYNKTFNRMIANGADTTSLNEMLEGFGGRKGLSKMPPALNPKLFAKGGGVFKRIGKNLGKKLGPLSAATFFVVDLNNEGFGAATVNAAKSATFYDITIEPVGDAYNDVTDAMIHNSTYGTFNEDAPGAAGDFSRSINARRRALEWANGN